jgi:hypothetical protein
MAIAEKGKWTWARWGDFNNLSDLLDLLGWKTQVIAMLSSIFSYSWLWEPGNRPLAVIAALLVGIFVSIVSIVVQTKKNVKSIDSSYIGSTKGGPERQSVLLTRPRAEAVLPLSKIFRAGNEIHAIFLTGEGIFSRHHEYAHYIKRLILPNPEAKFLQLVQVSRGELGIYYDLPQQIGNTRVVVGSNKVRYIQEFIGISLLFCNPEQPTGWMHVGFSTPFIDADHQPILRIEKVRDREIFETFWNAYNKLWDLSISPPTI